MAGACVAHKTVTDLEQVRTAMAPQGKRKISTIDSKKKKKKKPFIIKET